MIGIDEAQGLYITLKLMQNLCKLCKYLQHKCKYETVI